MSITHAQLRQAFLGYFAAAGHTPVASSPLTPPEGDNSLMFVNAGMVQFKDVFLGLEERPYRRAASCQKCMRVSGKHNDLEEVGRTARHHTLFEMLGNFSFGDYFKEEAIELAWRLITQEFKLPRERLYVTYFGGTRELPADTEAQALWQKISGLGASQLQPRGEADNFWSMGAVGPCGPCTEIYIDQAPHLGTPTEADFESGRVMEIWNNVFMQFSRDESGKLSALPQASVDTGMGLERMLAVLSGVDSNYHTDLFLPLIDGMAARADKRYGRSDSEDDVSLRVIADHARALAFLVADGVAPLNEGRGYVLRRIVRRAIRHGRRLGLKERFLAEATLGVVDIMGSAYPELVASKSLIEKLAVQEEESFGRTLDTGLTLLSQALGETLSRVKSNTRQNESASTPTLSGEVIFKLYDTYGFPKDLTETIAQERGIALDHEGFAAQMAAQQERSRGSAATDAGAGHGLWRQLVGELGATDFAGYPHEDLPLAERSGTWRESGERLELQTTVTALIRPGLAGGGPERCDSARRGETVDVVLGSMPLYGEGGGQVGDTGLLLVGDTPVARVLDCWRPVGELMVARVEVLAEVLEVGEQVWAGYEAARRRAIRAHHSATHLLHGALRATLGDHVRQAGSLVADSHLRFDFTHFSALSAQELGAVEDYVNARIARRAPVQIEELSFAAAREAGAMALFGEKYGEVVRVIRMDDSIELCGGTHVDNTAELGLMLLSRDQAVKAGVRRVEAVVGRAAVDRLAQLRRRLAALAKVLGAPSTAQKLDDASAAAQTQGDDALASDREAAPIFEALVRSKARAQAALTALGDPGRSGPQLGGQGLGVDTSQVPPAKAGLDLIAARALRDTWQTIVALVQGKLSDGEKLIAELGTRDVGHLAGGCLALLVAEREGERARADAAREQEREGAGELIAQAHEVGGIQVLAHVLPPDEHRDLKQLADYVRQALGSALVCLVQAEGERVTVLIALTKDLTQKFHAGRLIGELAPLVGGRGGGRPDLAQAGGRDPGGIARLLRRLDEMILAAAT